MVTAKRRLFRPSEPVTHRLWRGRWWAGTTIVLGVNIRSGGPAGHPRFEVIFPLFPVCCDRCRAIEATGVSFSFSGGSVLQDGLPKTAWKKSEERIAPRERDTDEPNVVGHRGRPSPHPRLARRLQVETVDAVLACDLTAGGAALTRLMRGSRSDLGRKRVSGGLFQGWVAGSAPGSAALGTARGTAARFWRAGRCSHHR